MRAVRLNVDAISGGFVNMMLSYRGSERQAPNVLQMSLRFSAAMDARALQGVHGKDLVPEERLRKVVAEFHETSGMLQRWHLDEDRFVSVLNLITGTCVAVRDIIAAHLHKFKWSQCALNSELLRRPRWLLSAVPRGCADHFKVLLSVTEASQKLFMQLVIHRFNDKARKARANQRARCRVTVAEWDAYVSYSCVFAKVIKEAMKLSNPPDMEILHKAFLDKDYYDEIEAIIKVEPAGWTVQKLCLWTDLVQKDVGSKALPDMEDEKTIEDREEEVETANFAAVKAKIASLRARLPNLHTCAIVPTCVVAEPCFELILRKDESKWCAFNAAKSKRASMAHVVDVQHTKEQSAKGEKKCIVFHSTSYDGALEKACVALSCPVWGVTTELACHKLASKLIRGHLLEEWKNDTGLIKGAKYVQVPPQRPEEVAAPEFLVCKEEDGKLIIPVDVRQKWLQDPCRSAEWKRLLQQFDKIHGAHAEVRAVVAPVPSTPPPAQGSATNSSPAPSGVTVEDNADPWKAIFEGEPRTLDDLVNKYGEPSATFSAPGSSGFVIKVVEGPKMFLCAPVAGAMDCNETPLLSHGAGTWLLDNKAEKMMKDNPDKVHVAEFTTDQCLCVLEAFGGGVNSFSYGKMGSCFLICC
eukprot:Skav215474  [mRNA]  locus=scaffold1089:880060:886109:- [translate_table: standard]